MEAKNKCAFAMQRLILWNIYINTNAFTINPSRSIPRVFFHIIQYGRNVLSKINGIRIRESKWSRYKVWVRKDFFTFSILIKTDVGCNIEFIAAMSQMRSVQELFYTIIIFQKNGSNITFRTKIEAFLVKEISYCFILVLFIHACITANITRKTLVR